MRGLTKHRRSCKHYLESLRLSAAKLSQRVRESEARKRVCIRVESPSPPAIDPPPVSPPPFLNESASPDLDIEPVDTPPSPQALGRGRRTKRPTWKVIETRHAAQRNPLRDDEQRIDTPIRPEPEFDVQRTKTNKYGLFCQYLHAVPTRDENNPSQFTPTPINFVEPASSVPSTLRAFLLEKCQGNADDPLALNGCSNISSRLIMEWHSASSTKSLEDTNVLVHSVIRHALLNPSDLTSFDAHREARAIDTFLSKQSDSWIEKDVDIEVPNGTPHPPTGDVPVPRFTVKGLVYRPLVEIIRAVWSSPEAAHFQYIPFRHFWKQGPDGVEEQVYGELFTSEAFNNVYEELQRQPPEPGCTLERVVCAMMCYSDSTHLANFGSASLWPLYLFFGNQSKYIRVCPSSGSCHHVAYIPKVRLLHRAFN